MAVPKNTEFTDAAGRKVIFHQLAARNQSGPLLICGVSVLVPGL